MMKKSTKIFILLSLVIVSSGYAHGQGKQKPKPKVAATTAAVDASDFYGSAENGVYVNKFFGFQLTAPEAYTFIPSAEAEIHSRSGIDMIKGQNNAANKKFDEAMTKQATLFGWLEFPMGEPGNSVIESVAVKQVAGVTSNMSLAASTKLITSNPNLKITKSLGSVTFGKKAFAGVILSVNLNGKSFFQEIYITMIRGYSVNFTLTYFDEIGRQKMLDVMRSIDFKK